MRSNSPAPRTRGLARRGAALVAPNSRYLPTAKLWLLFADVTCALGAAVIALVVCGGPGAISPSVVLSMFASAATVAAAGYAFGLYDDGRVAAGVRGAVLPAAIAVVAARIAAASAADVALHAEWYAHATAATLTLVGTLLVRAARAAAAARGIIGSRCIILGTPEQALPVAELVKRHPHASMSILGVVQPSGSWLPIETLETGGVLGAPTSLREAVKSVQADLVVMAEPPRREDAELQRALRALSYAGTRVIDFTALHEELAREIPLDGLDDEWLLLASTNSSRFHARHLKRLMDIVGAILLLLPGSVVIAVAALAIRLTSKGPIIFRQERLGLFGEPFMVLKLRTMYEDAEQRGAMWATEDDPRITPVGRVLRKFRIDELPQLLNVLRGEMSLIGPRPERPTFSERITETVPLFPERLMVRPGITGWAQVMAPYASSVDDSRKKLQLDLYYAKHLSAGLDLLIAAKTVKTVVFGREREQGGLVAGQQLAIPPTSEPSQVHRIQTRA